MKTSNTNSNSKTLKFSPSMLLKKAYLGCVFFFLYAPIIVLMVFSFNDSTSRATWEGFTFRWYESLLTDTEVTPALVTTFVVAIIAAIVSTIFGTFAAVVIDKMGKTARGITMEMTLLPVLNPDIVTGVALMMLFIFTKVPFGYVTLILAHVTFCVPYVILSVLPKLKQMNNNLYEAAVDLGATPFFAFRKIILPELMPGVITGAILAFTLSLDDFVISFFTTGNGVSNLSIAVYAMARKGVSPTVNAVSTIMFIVIMVLLAVVQIRLAKEDKKKSKFNG